MVKLETGILGEKPKNNFSPYLSFLREIHILPFLAKNHLFAVFEERFSDFVPKVFSFNCKRDIWQL